MLVNDDLDRTFSDLKAILAAERLRRERQSGWAGSWRRFWRRRARRLRPSQAERIRQRDIAGDRDCFRARRLGQPGRGDQGGCIGRDGFEALAQHLAALPEGGAGDGFERAHPAGQGVAARVRRTTLEVTFGGGTKAEGGTSKRMRARVRQPASTPRRP